MVSYKTRFISKQPNLEPKLVSTLSKITRMASVVPRNSKIATPGDKTREPSETKLSIKIHLKEKSILSNTCWDTGSSVKVTQCLSSYKNKKKLGYILNFVLKRLINIY
jgi:hypothetical protein